MSQNNDYQQFLPEHQLDRERLVMDVPAYPKSPYPERIPAGYEPMGEISLRGRAYRSLAGGRIPWWVMVSGWIFFGGFALSLLLTAIISSSFELFIPLAILAIPIIVLGRGTSAKLSISKYRKRKSR